MISWLYQSCSISLKWYLPDIAVSQLRSFEVRRSFQLEVKARIELWFFKYRKKYQASSFNVFPFSNAVPFFSFRVPSTSRAISYFVFRLVAVVLILLSFPSVSNLLR